MNKKEVRMLYFFYKYKNLHILKEHRFEACYLPKHTKIFFAKSSVDSLFVVAAPDVGTFELPPSEEDIATGAEEEV